MSFPPGPRPADAEPWIDACLDAMLRPQPPPLGPTTDLPDIATYRNETENRS